MLRYVTAPGAMLATWPSDYSHRIFTPRSKRQVKAFGNASTCEVVTPNLTEKQEPHSHNVILFLDNVVLP